MGEIDYEKLSAHEFIVHKVDQFLITTEMQPYLLGLKACGSVNFYPRLLKGKARLTTITAVERYMSEELNRRTIDAILEGYKVNVFGPEEAEVFDSKTDHKYTWVADKELSSQASE